MKLSSTQKESLNLLSQAIKALTWDCVNDDEFNDLIADQAWFHKSFDEIRSEIPDLIEEQDELSLDIALTGEEAELLAKHFNVHSDNVTVWSDGAMSIEDPQIHYNKDYWMIPDGMELSQTIKLHLGETIVTLFGENQKYNLFAVDR